MGTKRSLHHYQMLFTNGSSSGTMSGTSTIHTQSTNCQNWDNIGLDVSWTGTPTGTITVECGIGTDQQNLDNTITYRALTFDPVLAQPAGSAGAYLVNLNQVPFSWVRVSYTNVSGSGVLSVKLSAKDLN